jgi:VIT1/CCC1 family predicted Fe2+/Mn2+ transporter
LIPFLLFDVQLAFWISVAWGLLVLVYVSYRLAKSQKLKPGQVIREHLTIAVAVLIIGHYLGRLIAYYIN